MTPTTGTVSWCCVARDNFKNDDGSMVDPNKGDKIESVWNSNPCVKSQADDRRRGSKRV